MSLNYKSNTPPNVNRWKRAPSPHTLSIPLPSVYVLPNHEHTGKDLNSQDIACFFVHAGSLFLLSARVLPRVELLHFLMTVSSICFSPFLLLSEEFLNQ